MMTFARVLRLQLWVLGIWGILLVTAFAFVLGPSYASFVVGWGIAVFWTAMLLIEGSAYVFERWRSALVVPRATKFMATATMIATLLLFVLPWLRFVVIILSETMWFDLKSYIAESVFGGSYWVNARFAVAILVTWAFMFGFGQGVRALLSHGTSDGVSTARWLKIVLIVMLVVMSLVIPGLVAVSLRWMRNMSWSEWYAGAWREQALPTFKIVGYACFLFVSMRTLLAWIRMSSTIRTLQVIIVSALLCMVPFFYGFARYGPTLHHLDVMENIYAVVTALLPFVFWGIHTLFTLRKRQVLPPVTPG
ncbi:MAG: hypothetical protein A2X68_12505 [Ignavibacteria bacterium GWC2_56_12]|nr:MAG: hypothetical protein A2X68_12505 [Ignavibacteria bacterium GWC2_56_12]